MNGFSETYDYVKATTDSIKKIEKVVGTCSSFKIGKTGQSLQDRFDSEYKDQYDRIVEVYCSSNESEISALERWLIEYFQTLEKYSSKCDNKASGGGDMDYSSKYYIYVVVKD